MIYYRKTLFDCGPRLTAVQFYLSLWILMYPIRIFGFKKRLSGVFGICALIQARLIKYWGGLHYFHLGALLRIFLKKYK